jgi:hypothetical protein
MKEDAVMQTGNKTKYKHVFVCDVARSGTSRLGRNIAGVENCTGFNNTGAGSDEGEILQDVYSIAVASAPMKMSRRPSSNGTVVAAGPGARAFGV